MPCKDCHCGPCKCVGCLSVTISGLEDNIGAVGPCDTMIAGAYNRRVTLWQRVPSTVSPFSYLAVEPEEAASYPGTKCRWVGDLCCGPNVDDELPDPDEPEDPDIEPPPPPPPPTP